MSDLFKESKAIELRPYQLEAIERVRSLIREGKKNILLCAPTGSGKTVIGSHLINEADRKGRRAAFVVDRVTLINQTSETFDDYGIDHGVVQADHPRKKPWKHVQICSAQTVGRRKWPDANLLVIDEAHTVMKVVVDRITPRDTITIGLTATPFTRGLGKLYDGLVNVTTTAKLIQEGFLAPYRIFAAVEPNMEGVKVVAGEWVDGEASKRALEVVGDVVAEYLKHGENRKFICSACDVAHVEELARQFLAAGINVATYTYRVSDEDRADIVREFKRPDSNIRGLITVTAASKGFDVPDIGCVIMARPLRKSLAEHIQFFGRGLRIHPSKKDCIVLDHSGNCARFWDEWNEFFETGALELDDGKKRELKKKPKGEESDSMVKCGQCKHLHKPLPRCPVCGFEYPKKASIQHVPGTLKEMLASGNRELMTKQIWPQIVSYALERKEGDAARKMALALYKQMTGDWPKSDFFNTEPIPVTSAVQSRIRSLNIRWAKAREAQQRQEAVAA
jgi:superfamily II DNA or RNA helicase